MCICLCIWLSFQIPESSTMNNNTRTGRKCFKHKSSALRTHRLTPSSSSSFLDLQIISIMSTDHDRDRRDRDRRDRDRRDGDHCDRGRDRSPQDRDSRCDDERASMCCISSSDNL